MNAVAPPPASSTRTLVPSRGGHTVAARRSPVPARGWTLLLAALGGLLTDTAFPNRSWWPMAYVGVALLLLALRRDSLRWGWLVGFLWGLGFFLPHLFWANEAVGEPIGWIALSIAQAALVGLFGAGWVLVARVPQVAHHGWLQVPAAAVLWVSVEQVRARWPFGGFPWGTLAFSQTDAPVLALASIGSTVLVSGTVVAVGALLALAVVRLPSGWDVRAGAPLLVAAGLVVAPLAVPSPVGPETGSLRVGAVQGNVPVQGAEALSQARAITENHAAGTEALVEQVGRGSLDVVLWPESSADIDPRTDADVAASVERATRAAGAPVLLGTQRYVADDQDPGLRTRYNEMILWDRGGPTGLTYTKQHPVPFGEYMPYRDFFRTFTSAVDLISVDMAAGQGTGLMPVDVERLGRAVPLTVGICFEVAYDELIRESVVAGGELIVIPTNNASFGRTQESTQQLAMSRFRAAEHGRAVVQISTVGVSGLIAPDGEVLDATGLFTTEQMTADLPLRTSLTLSAQLGQWPAALAAALTVLGLVAGLVATVGGRREGGTRGTGRRGRPTDDATDPAARRRTAQSVQSAQAVQSEQSGQSAQSADDPAEARLVP